MRVRHAVLLFGMLSTVGGGGCSAFRPAQQSIMIDTVPTGVNVVVDGTTRGPAPVTVKLDRNASHRITASTQGASYTRELNPKLSTTGTLDILGASILLVPGIGLLTPGAWDLDTINNSMRVVLHLDGSDPTSEPATGPSVEADAK